MARSSSVRVMSHVKEVFTSSGYRFGYALFLMLLAHLRHTQNLSQNLLGTCYCSGLGVHLVRLVLSSADGIRSRRLDPSRHTGAKPSPFAIKRFPGPYSTPRLPPAPPPAPGHQSECHRSSAPPENLSATGKNQFKRCPEPGGRVGRNADGAALGYRSGVASEILRASSNHPSSSRTGLQLRRPSPNRSSRT